MAIQFTDFSSKPLLDAPGKDIFEDILKGYQMGKEPANMKRDADAKDLANKLKQLDVEHKPKQYDLDDKAKDFANQLQKAAISRLPKKYAMEEALNDARIKKLNGNNLTNVLKPNGKVANIAWVKKELERDDVDPQSEYAQSLKNELRIEQEQQQTGNERRVILNASQHKRDSTPITKKHLEIKDIDEGYYPGTKNKISPENQTKMKNDLLLSIVKDTTDPKVREKLINASNMNITLDSIDPEGLTQYSGGSNKSTKLADSIIEGFGSGSPQYKSYQRELIKAMAAAKQMRQYLGDSIQPAAQDRLDNLTNPEAWNVSPQLAKENFNFMKDLFKRETQTLVRAAQDPSLYTASGNSGNTEERDLVFNPATGRLE